MHDLTFGTDGKVQFPTKYNGQVFILREKWEIICEAPERFYYKENAEKIATILINPDLVRENSNYKNQVIYYKSYDKIRINGQEVDSKVKFWGVVVDYKEGKIRTIYPLPKPKVGKEYKGGGA